MIDLLVEQLVPFTLITILILLIHSLLQRLLGVKHLYQLWLIVPISLIVPFIEFPNWFAMINDGHSVQHYIVKSNMIDIPQSSSLLLFLAWLIGAGLLIGYGGVVHLKFKLKLKNAQKISQPLPIVLPDNLPAYESAEAYSPMIFGIGKSKLILPEHFFEIYNQEQQMLILEHEVCHFNRNDMYWNLIALSCLTLMWFHPLAWLALIRFRRDQEISCDHAVLARKHITSRINYSKALLVTAETAPPLAFAQLTFNKYGDKNVMIERIKQIKANHSSTKLVKSTVIALTLGLLSAVSYAGNNAEPTKEHAINRHIVEPIMRVEPKYPIKAAIDKIEGFVVLKFDISAQGDVKNISVIKTNPADIFNKVSKTALEQWKYSPSVQGSKNNLVQLDFAMDLDSEDTTKE